MRKNLSWAFVVVVAALVQTTWPQFIRVGGVEPDLTLLLVVFFAVADGEERAMFTGLLGGVFQDVLGDAALGHHVLCHVVVGYLVGRLSTRLVTEHPAVKAGLVLCAGALDGLLYTFVQYVQDPDLPVVRTVLAVTIPRAFYTTMLTPVAFYILARVFPQDTPIRGEFE